MRFAILTLAITGLAGSLGAACLQSNLTTGAQSSGAVYAVYMPEATCWNGMMVVYAHGYVAPGSAIGVPTDQLSVGGLSLPAVFNQLGFGFAASSYSKNGLAITQGVADTADLVKNIIQPQLHPQRVYLIGASEGGLVTALSAERSDHLYNAAGAACGPIGSFQGQINYLGDFRVVFDYFFPGVIPGSPVSIPSEVIANWYTVYVPKITAALIANPGNAAQVISVMHAPVTSDPATVGETIIGALWYNVFATNDAVATLGGQPFDNHDRFYFGSKNDLLLNLKIQRFYASPAAKAAIAAGYETTGKLTMPAVTLHTTGDPVIPYWHETLYTWKTLAAGTLLKRINLPVSAYGHCNFSSGDILTAFGLMLLSDLGQNIAAQIQSTLPTPHAAGFTQSATQHGLLH